MIIEKIKTGTNEEVFVQAYEIAFPKVASFVRKMGGSLEEAKDIFQEALVIYYERAASESVTPVENQQQYLTGIAKHLWYKHYREKKNQRPLDHFGALRITEEEPKVSPALLQFVERSGKKCLDLLKAFYYDKLNMKVLADTFGFASDRSATSQKFKCLEKIRQTVKERSLTKEDFYE